MKDGMPAVGRGEGVRLPTSPTARTWTDHLLLSIFRRFPPGDSIFKESDARAEGEYQSEVELPFFAWFRSGPGMLSGKDVLDLGCGFGGRSVRFAEFGARVTGVEVDEDRVSHAREFALRRGIEATFVKGFGEAIPAPDSSFDLVTMFDVMEHVVSPQAVLAECFRVLRPGGALAVVFPPYYDLTCGSHLHGYATTFPGLNLLFSTRALRSAVLALFAEQDVEWRPFLREVPTDKLWNMNGLSVRGFRRLVRTSGFEVGCLNYFGHRDLRISTDRGLSRLLRAPVSLPLMLAAQIPLLQEAVCARIVAILVKPEC